MGAAAQLPEVLEVEGRIVRVFPFTYAKGFPRLPQSERRATPAIVRRVYAAAAKHADEDCLICGERAPLGERTMVAVEMAGGHDIGCICTDCSGVFQAT